MQTESERNLTKKIFLEIFQNKLPEKQIDKYVNLAMEIIEREKLKNISGPIEGLF